MNRSGRPAFSAVRSLLEDWFARYPVQFQKDLGPRLRSKDNGVFSSAFFELSVHELLRATGYDVQVHPQLAANGKAPDFLAQRAGAPGLVVEAVVASNQSAIDKANGARVARIHDALNTVRSPDFFLWIEIDGEPRTPVPERQLRLQVESFLRTLDYDKFLGLTAEESIQLPQNRGLFEHDGMRIVFYGMPKSSRLRGRPGIRPLGAYGPAQPRMVDDVSALRASVKAKASRYGVLERPYIIAVNAMARPDLSDISEALFGSQPAASSLRPQTDLSRRDRRQVGAFVGPRGPENTRVSAVLVIGGLHPWTIGSATALLCHNPWASYSADGALEELASARLVDGVFEERDGNGLRSVFGLSERWPD